MTLRFFYPLDQILTLKREALPFEQRKHFVFLGNYRHAPNLDGCRWLIEQIWPQIHAALPETELHLYGSYPTREASNFHQPKQGIIFKGPTENSLQTLGNYRINLAPLRFGAGIKGKLSEGWLAGTPSTSTSIGAEGMHGQKPFPGAIQDLSEDFAKAASALYRDQTRWEKAQRQGYELLETLYGKENESPRLLSMLDELRDTAHTKRKTDFLYQLLWHQSLRSSEYFSRWIQEKSTK